MNKNDILSNKLSNSILYTMGYIYGIKYIGDKSLLTGRSKSLLSSKYCYIGQSVDYIPRWNAEKREVRTGSMNSVLYDTIRHHGIDMFEWIVLLIVDDDSMDKVEDDYIRKYSLHPNGLNLKGGGNSGKYTEEAKLRMSESRKKYFARLDDRERERIRLRIQQKALEPEVRKKNSESQIARFQTEAGKGTAKRHSDFMKSDAAKANHVRANKTKRERNKTPEGQERVKKILDNLAQWRESPEGIESMKNHRERMIQLWEEKRKHIPKRDCEMCGFKNPDNKPNVLAKHLQGKIHKGNEKFTPEILNYIRTNPDKLTYTELATKFTATNAIIGHISRSNHVPYY
jgi:hypothetical protein